MNTVSINGVTISGVGNIVISNGRVTIGGKDVTPEGKSIEIVVNGNIERLEVDSCSKVSVTGDIQNVKTQSGDVDVSGTVSGNIQTMSGDVDCSNVGGSISTMSGDVKYRK